MTEQEIAGKYVHGKHDALTDAQEIKDMAADILNFAKEYHAKQLSISLDEQLEVIKQWLIDQDFEGLAERL